VFKDELVKKLPTSHLDLLTGTNVAVLSTVSSDGYPHNTTALFLLDDDGRVKISAPAPRSRTAPTARKYKGNVFILDPVNAGRYIEIHADFEELDDPDASFEQRVGAKYGIRNVRSAEPAELPRLILVANPVQVTAIG
jgi:hypothetical protein